MVDHHRICRLTTALTRRHREIDPRGVFLSGFSPAAERPGSANPGFQEIPKPNPIYYMKKIEARLNGMKVHSRHVACEMIENLMDLIEEAQTR